MRDSAPRGHSRRGVLRALALAPAALAGCAAGRTELAARPEDGAKPARPAPSVPAPAPAAVAAVRAFRLPPDADPAFVFRAAPARLGEPR